MHRTPVITYDPSSSTTTVTLEVDGAKTATLTVGRTMQTWTWKSADIGTHTLKIVCGSVSKTISVQIKELGITIEPVKTNLAFDFNPAGKTNSDETRLWTDGNNRLTVSDNFDWSNGGYQLDEDGDTYFCVKAGTTANISYKLFGDDAKKLGKNFKLVFKTTNVKNYDATALTCLNGGIGLNIQAQKVTLTSEQNSISLPTCEDDFMEFEFNILPDSQYKEMVLWLDGIPCRVELYDASDNFTQASPVGITIGSPDCDVLVYRMKSYMMNLTDDEILDNFIADAKNAEEMIERAINKNQFATAGHNHDSRYYTESEIDSKLDDKSNVGHTHDYLPTAGGTMNGTITFSDSSHGKIYSGPTDNVNGPGGDLNNIVIESWNGLSFTTGCPNQTYTGKTAVGIDCREGVVKAARFDGTLTGTAATLGGGGNPYAPMTFNWSGKDGQPTWLWGGEDGTNMYVYNPGNFKVNWAQSAANGVYANGFDGSGGGYIRFCNGAQICWGRTNCSGKDTTINFSAAFSNSSYSVSTMPFYSSLADTYWNVKEGSMGTTGFVLHGSKSSIDLRTMLWIAIGKWN